jgi:hypothetical protein
MTEKTDKPSISPMNARLHAPSKNHFIAVIEWKGPGCIEPSHTSTEFVVMDYDEQDPPDVLILTTGQVMYRTSEKNHHRPPRIYYRPALAMKLSEDGNKVFPLDMNTLLRKAKPSEA